MLKLFFAKKLKSEHYSLVLEPFTSQNYTVFEKETRHSLTVGFTTACSKFNLFCRVETVQDRKSKKRAP